MGQPVADPTTLPWCRGRKHQTSGNIQYFSRAWELGVYNTAGGYNIYIGKRGGSSTESNTIRIGIPDESAALYLHRGHLRLDTSSGGVPVYINSNGQLGTLTSSRRFKEQIRDMGDSTNALMKLRPVTFLYKPEYDKGPRTLQYGLIAEEVAEVYPELVAYEPDGKPYTVKYQYLTTMLLNEMQKQYHRADDSRVIKRNSKHQSAGRSDQDAAAGD